MSRQTVDDEQEVRGLVNSLLSAELSLYQRWAVISRCNSLFYGVNTLDFIVQQPGVATALFDFLSTQEAHWLYSAIELLFRLSGHVADKSEQYPEIISVLVRILSEKSISNRPFLDSSIAEKRNQRPFPYYEVVQSIFRFIVIAKNERIIEIMARLENLSWLAQLQKKIVTYTWLDAANNARVEIMLLILVSLGFAPSELIAKKARGGQSIVSRLGPILHTYDMQPNIVEVPYIVDVLALLARQGLFSDADKVEVRRQMELLRWDTRFPDIVEAATKAILAIDGPPGVAPTKCWGPEVDLWLAVREGSNEDVLRSLSLGVDDLPLTKVLEGDECATYLAQQKQVFDKRVARISWLVFLNKAIPNDLKQGMEHVVLYFAAKYNKKRLLEAASALGLGDNFTRAVQYASQQNAKKVLGAGHALGRLLHLKNNEVSVVRPPEVNQGGGGSKEESDKSVKTPAQVSHVSVVNRPVGSTDAGLLNPCVNSDFHPL